MVSASLRTQPFAGPGREACCPSRPFCAQICLGAHDSLPPRETKPVQSHTPQALVDDFLPFLVSLGRSSFWCQVTWWRRVYRRVPSGLASASFSLLWVPASLPAWASLVQPFGKPLGDPAAGAGSRRANQTCFPGLQPRTVTWEGPTCDGRAVSDPSGLLSQCICIRFLAECVSGLDVVRCAGYQSVLVIVFIFVAMPQVKGL